jgi:hypothetical protein
MIKEYIVSALAVADIAAMVFDVSKTEEGLKKGVAEEGNSTVTYLFGMKPGTTQLDLWNGAWIAAFAVLGLVHFGDLRVAAAAAGASTVALGVDTVKHYLGGRLWSALLSGKKLKQDRTAWQKFLGLGIGD